MTVEINKQYGFYGAMRNQFQDEFELKTIWKTILTRLTQMYPEKTQDDIVAFLNSKAGRHLADEILDCPDQMYAIVMLRIAMLSKLSTLKWWAYYHDVAPVPEPVNKRLLYQSAIKHAMRKKNIRKLMLDLLDCKRDMIWKDVKTWVDSQFVKEQELELIWTYIQQKLKNKGK